MTCTSGLILKKKYSFLMMILCWVFLANSGVALGSSEEPSERLKTLILCQPKVPVEICKIIDDYTPDEKISRLIRVYQNKKKLYAVGGVLCLPMALTCPLTCLVNFFCCDETIFCYLSCQTPIMVQKYYYLDSTIKFLKQIETEDDKKAPLANVLAQPNQSLTGLTTKINANFYELSDHPDHDNIFPDLIGVEWPDPLFEDEE